MIDRLIRLDRLSARERDKNKNVRLTILLRVYVCLCKREAFANPLRERHQQTFFGYKVLCHLPTFGTQECRQAIAPLFSNSFFGTRTNRTQSLNYIKRAELCVGAPSCDTATLKI